MSSADQTQKGASGVPYRNVPAADYVAMGFPRPLVLTSKVGDWIWLQLCHGKTPKQIKTELAAMVDDLAARNV